MIATAIPRTVGVYSVHKLGQGLREGIGVYEYDRYWQCEVHGAWVPSRQTGEPCEHIRLVLEAKETP